MQAVTSVAQTLDDADAARDLETQAPRVMDLACSKLPTEVTGPTAISWSDQTRPL
jgi:hypothetical protein